MNIYTRRDDRQAKRTQAAIASALKWSFGALAGLFLFAQPYRPVVVKGESMMPNLVDGQILIGKRVDRTLQAGDLIVFRWPEGRAIKRVAKTAGEYYNLVEGREFLAPIPSGYYYVLGDYPEKSVDSRMMGLVRDDAIDMVIIASFRLPWS